MTELKTLLDIQRCSICDTDFKIRQEAIKWIKTFRNQSDDFVGIALSDAKKGEEVNLMISIDETWIKHFFNITEEDLK